MKTRFNINEVLFSYKGTWDGCCDYYEKYLKQHGFILDKEMEYVFKEFDRLIILNEGDRVEIDGIGSQIITWKCYDVDNDTMTYSLEEERQPCTYR